jgi:hypothetical protein
MKFQEKCRKCIETHIRLVIDRVFLVHFDPRLSGESVATHLRDHSEDFAAGRDVLAYLAAGPLEDLLARHPHAFIDRIERLATSDAHFRRAVSGVWGWNSIPSDVRARLDTLLEDEPRL